MQIYAYHAPTFDFMEAKGNETLVRFRVPTGLVLERAWVRSEPDNEEHLSPMSLCRSDERWNIWQGVLHLNPADDLTLYCFKMMVGGRQFWLHAAGVSPYYPERKLHFHHNPAYRPARWVWSQVFYQIFPERFCDGDASNNVASGAYEYGGRPVVAKTWDELPERANGPREFFGGDLAGIRQRLDYLEDLGVSALYLNPIFASPSSHKYDTTDYYRIDPHFGSNDEFAELCADLKRRGMRLILDAVVNHTSERHPWFDRYGEHETPGAYRSSSSPTRNYYTFADPDDPESYSGWNGVKTLPVLDYAEPEVRRRVFEADDAILRYWMRPPYRIDGWRFDVVHMLGEGAGAHNNASYVRHFRQTLRQENPEAYVLGEHFFEASRWLQGDQEDAAMNYYGFGLPLRAFLAGVDHRRHGVRIDAADFGHLLRRALTGIPFAIQLSQLNLIDSHDTARFLTVAGGDRAVLKLAATLLFTFVGVPCVYYGDEVGLEGEDDPDCRRPFPWDEKAWDHDVRDHFKTLIAFRRSSLALREGAFVELHARGDVYAFARQLGAETVVVLVNRGDATSVELPVWQLGLRDEALGSLLESGGVKGDRAKAQDGRLALDLAAKSSYVYVVE